MIKPTRLLTSILRLSLSTEEAIATALYSWTEAAKIRDLLVKQFGLAG